MKNALNASMFINQKGGANDAHILSPHKALFLIDTIQFREGVIRIAQERIWKLVFRCKLVMRFNRVRRDTENCNTSAFDLGKSIPKRAGLFRASRRIILWVEVQNDLFAAEVRQTYLLSPLIGGCKVRSDRTLFKHRISLSEADIGFVENVKFYAAPTDQTTTTTARS